MMTEQSGVDLIEAEIQRHWSSAQARWSRFLLLNNPNVSSETPSVAQIALSTRQITLNAELISKYDLFDCIEGLLAHEIGHHVRYPGTLVVEARMRMLQRSIIPLEGYSLTNIFQDLMINEHLGKDDLQIQLIKVYQAFSSEPAFHADMRWKRDPAFVFYLALYESLWQLPAASLMGSIESEFGEAFPGYRAEAHVLVHNLFRMEPNVYTQFLYFTSVLSRYLKPMIDQQLQQWMACRCGQDQPSPGDWADALTPTDAEKQAIERAVEAGWFEEDQAERLRKLNELEERIACLPGFGTDDATQIPEVMAAHYRGLAERYLVKPPALPRLGESIVPTTLDDWEHADPVSEIDWLTTLMNRGPELGSAHPLKRTRVAEQEGYDVRLWQPRVEIYLDVSGSMPNPIFHLNAMTLSAQILTLATTRAGGSVRVAMYSHEPVLYWSWCRSEIEMSRFLMHYIGGGTDFPFQLLAKSCDECSPDNPIRIVISDTDFDHNFESHPDNRGIFVTATEKSAHWILLLHHPKHERVKLYESLGASVITIEEMTDFPQMATELSESLFPSSDER